MRAITILAVEIYRKLGHIPLNERIEATRQYILKEITQWSVKGASPLQGIIAFKPEEFDGTPESPPFEVRIIQDENDKEIWELKFGNFKEKTEDKMYKWNDKDPSRMQKALFLIKVLETIIVPYVETGRVKGIKFNPYDGDGLGSDRLSYFESMFKKLNKNGKFDFKKEGDHYIITTK